MLYNVIIFQVHSLTICDYTEYICYILKGTIRNVLASVLVLKVSRKIILYSTFNNKRCRSIKLTAHGHVCLGRILN